MPKVVVRVDFVFDPDEFQGKPADMHRHVWARQVAEAFLHQEADMPKEHEITSVEDVADATI